VKWCQSRVLARLDSDTLVKYRVQQTRRSAQVVKWVVDVGVGGVIEACCGQFISQICAILHS
jgi:hypothetical protein